VVDPDSIWITDIDFNPGVDMLQYTLLHSMSVPHRIWAGTVLLKEVGTKVAFEIVGEALKSEKFYGVTQEIGKVLQSLPYSSYGHSLTVDLLSHVTHPKPLAHLLLACKHKNPILRKAVLDYIHKAKSDPSIITYRALSFAFEALGYHGNKEDVAVLSEGVLSYAKTGYVPFISAGAIRGLGHHRSKEALQFVSEHVVYGKLPEYVRPFAVKTIAELASWFDHNTVRETTETLAFLLVEQSEDIITAAVSGLVTLGSKSSIPFIEDSKKRVSNQTSVWIDRQIIKLNEKKESNVFAQMKGEIEKLQQRVDSLEKKAS